MLSTEKSNNKTSGIKLVSLYSTIRTGVSFLNRLLVERFSSLLFVKNKREKITMIREQDCYPQLVKTLLDWPMFLSQLLTCTATGIS